jgi:hypothetical protein
MPSIFEDTFPRSLKELLQQIHSREAALPDFQRDFVWEPNATQELIVSIASNFPAGSLLRVRNTRKLFAFREFQGAPPLHQQPPTYLVLDGQQRLTSLYQAFYGVGDHLYFVRLRDMLDEGKPFEDCIFHLRRNTRQAKALGAIETQAAELTAPLSVLKDGIGGFTHWSRAVARREKDHDKRVMLEDKLEAMERGWVQIVDDYIFPVVTLSDETSADAICTIFETLNRTGVKLSVFELLTARFWPKGINLRQLWTRAQEEHPILADFAIDPYYILQVVSLVSRETPSCARGDVLDLEVSAIKSWWDRVVAALAKGLVLLQDDCGVVTSEWLPYYPIILPLGSVLARTDAQAGPMHGANRDKLVRWFWCSVFGQAYEAAANSQATKDTTQLLRWLAGGDEPETVRQFRFDPRMLRDATPRLRSLYRGSIALVLSHGPRDFYGGDPITCGLMREHSIDDHHIFPRAYLTKQAVSERLRDCVLNRTLIDRQTNILISDNPPSHYLKEVRASLGIERLQDLLESHLLPAAETSPLWSDSFDAFLEARQEALWREIQRVTGISTPTDLLSDEGVA